MLVPWAPPLMLMPPIDMDMWLVPPRMAHAHAARHARVARAGRLTRAHPAHRRASVANGQAEGEGFHRRAIEARAHRRDHGPDGSCAWRTGVALGRRWASSLASSPRAGPGARGARCWRLRWCRHGARHRRGRLARDGCADDAAGARAGGDHAHPALPRRARDRAPAHASWRPAPGAGDVRAHRSVVCPVRGQRGASDRRGAGRSRAAGVPRGLRLAPELGVRGPPTPPWPRHAGRISDVPGPWPIAS